MEGRQEIQTCRNFFLHQAVITESMRQEVFPDFFVTLTRSGPKIPAAGYLEGEGFFFGLDSDFGCFLNILELRQNNQIWNLVRSTKFGTSSEQPQVEFLVLKRALRVNSDHKIEFFSLCSLCEHSFFTQKASYRL